MNKSVVTHIFIIIVAVILGWLIAQNVHEEQKKLMPEMGDLSKAPLGGMHKVVSDTEWMLFINYCGSQDSINKNNVDKVIKKLDRLISLDPNFEKAYSVGVQMVAVEKPDKAIDFLKKACENEKLKNNWRIPFYTAFIMNHHCNPPRVKESVEYYEKAVRRAGSPEKFLVNAWIRARAKTALDNGESFYVKAKEGETAAKGEKLVNIYDAIMNELYQEWVKSDISGGDGGMDMGGGTMYSIIPDLRDRLLEAAKRAKEHANNNKDILAHVKLVRDTVTKGQKLDRKYMTAAEVATLPPVALKGSSIDLSAAKAKLAIAEAQALQRIKAAEAAAIKRIQDAAKKATSGK